MTNEAPTPAGKGLSAEESGTDAPGTARRKVTILVALVTGYRTPFYDWLRERLSARGIELQLVYGVGAGTFAERKDKASVSWAIEVPSRAIHLGPLSLVWQSGYHHTRDADLVILAQQIHFLANYPVILRQLLRRQRVAFWGHGRNYQGWWATDAAEMVKRWLSRRVHWWFAYNDLSARAVADLGYPKDRITNVQNAIDTTALVKLRAAVDDDQIDAARGRFGIAGGPEQHVGVFVGGLYAEKRLSVLLSAAERIRARLPTFELVVMGAGSEQHLVEAAAAQHEWIHYVGPQFDADKVALFALSKLLLMPGLVGLVVLDSFALETPLVTLADSPHSPEIDYLEHGVNGVVVDPAGADPGEAYADAVVDLLLDDARRERLMEGCRRARDAYTLEEMVRRYAEGIEAALDAPDLPR